MMASRHVQKASICQFQEQVGSKLTLNGIFKVVFVAFEA